MSQISTTEHKLFCELRRQQIINVHKQVINSTSRQAHQAFLVVILRDRLQDMIGKVIHRPFRRIREIPFCRTRERLVLVLLGFGVISLVALLTVVSDRRIIHNRHTRGAIPWILMMKNSFDVRKQR